MQIENFLWPYSQETRLRFGLLHERIPMLPIKHAVWVGLNALLLGGWLLFLYWKYRCAPWLAWAMLFILLLPLQSLITGRTIHEFHFSRYGYVLSPLIIGAFVLKNLFQKKWLAVSGLLILALIILSGFLLVRNNRDPILPRWRLITTVSAVDTSLTSYSGPQRTLYPFFHSITDSDRELVRIAAQSAYWHLSAIQAITYEFLSRDMRFSSHQINKLLLLQALATYGHTNLTQYPFYVALYWKVALVYQWFLCTWGLKTSSCQFIETCHLAQYSPLTCLAQKECRSRLDENLFYCSPMGQETITQISTMGQRALPDSLDPWLDNFQVDAILVRSQAYRYWQQHCHTCQTDKSQPIAIGKDTLWLIPRADRSSNLNTYQQNAQQYHNQPQQDGQARQPANQPIALWLMNIARPQPKIMNITQNHNQREQGHFPQSQSPFRRGEKALIQQTVVP